MVTMTSPFDSAYKAAAASLGQCGEDTTENDNVIEQSRRFESRDDDLSDVGLILSNETDDIEVGMDDGSTLALQSTKHPGTVAESTYATPRQEAASQFDGATSYATTNHALGVSSLATTNHAVGSSSRVREVKEMPNEMVQMAFGRSSFLTGRSSSTSNRLDGFVNGDFHSGKLLDLSIPQKCHAIQFHDSLLAVGLLEGHGLALYDASTLALLYTIERNDSVSAIQCLEENDEGGCLLAIGGLDGVVSLYRLNTNLVELQGASLIHEFRAQWQVRTMALAKFDEATTLLTVGDKDGNITFCQVTRSTEGSTVATGIEERLDSGVLGMDMYKQWFAACTKTGLVRVYALSKNKKGSVVLGKPLWSTQRNGPIRSVVFFKQGSRLVFGGYDKKLVLLDTKLWAITREIPMEGTINTISFDPLNRYIGVGSRDRSLVLFDTSTLVPIKTVSTPGWVTSLTWGTTESSKNLIAVRSDPRVVSVLDLTPTHQTNVRLSASREPSNYCVSWSHDGRYLARIDGSLVILSDSRKDFLDEARIDLEAGLKCVAFCKAEGSRNRLAVVGLSGNLHVLQVDTCAYSISLKSVHKSFVEKDLWVVAWSTNGTLLATGGKGKMLHLLSAYSFRKVRESLSLGGRLWDINFMPEKAISAGGEGMKACTLAVGTGDYMATLYDESSFQPTLQIPRTRTVRCIQYHPTLPILAIGDGSNLVSIVDLVEEETVQEFDVGGRVSSIEFSPCGGFLVVGSDSCRFTIHETDQYLPVQDISSKGFAVASRISSTGRYLALGSANDDYSVICMGAFLGTDMVPLVNSEQLEHLPSWALKESLYRSGYGPSMIQRYMREGSQGSMRTAALALQKHPDAMLTYDRSSGEGCFGTALALKRPTLLKLALMTVVDGQLEKDNVGGRSILTTDIPEQASAALLDMIKHQPPHFGADVLNSMQYTKVPFTSSFLPDRGSQRERGSDTFTDPWKRKPKDVESATEQNIDQLRTPAVLPLPGLGSEEFLSALLDMPPTVFDNEPMRLVLWVLWRDYIRVIFILDTFLYAVYCLLWIVYVDKTSSTSSIASDFSGTVKIAFAIALIALSCIFLLKEIVQSNFCRRRSYFQSLWNVVDYAAIGLVFGYVFSTEARGGTGYGLVPLAVVATIFLTMKFLSYLRGFGGTGWLISVLKQNFLDVRGFGVVLLSILVGFAVCFRLVFGDIAGSCSIGLDEQNQPAEECIEAPFGNIWRSLLSTFEMAVVGAYEPGLFDESRYSVLSIILFVAAVMCVLVVVLNALIAVLSDSYARVQANATANRRRERAELIVEYLSILPSWKRRQIEKSTLYFHALLVSDEDGDLLLEEDGWEGGLNTLRREIKVEHETTIETNRKEMEKLRSEINGDLAAFRKEIVAMLEVITEDVHELKRSKNGTLDGRRIKSAAKAIRSIGKKGQTK